MDVPKNFYRASLEQYPNQLPEIEYPAHFRVEKSYPNGVIAVGQTQWYISGCLRNEFIGLDEIDDDVYKVYFGSVALGILDGQNSKQRGNRNFGNMVRIDGDITDKRKRRPCRR